VSRLALKPTFPGLIRYFASASAQAEWSGQEFVADIVEVSDNRHVDTARHQPVADMRQQAAAASSRSTSAMQDDFRAGPPKLRHLPYGRLDIGGVGIGQSIARQMGRRRPPSRHRH